MTREELESLKAVINYNWDDEQKDYDPEHNGGHIFLDLEVLQAFVDKVKTAEETA